MEADCVNWIRRLFNCKQDFCISKKSFVFCTSAIRYAAVGLLLCVILFVILMVMVIATTVFMVLLS